MFNHEDSKFSQRKNMVKKYGENQEFRREPTSCAFLAGFNSSSFCGENKISNLAAAYCRAVFSVAKNQVANFLYSTLQSGELIY